MSKGLARFDYLDWLQCYGRTIPTHDIHINISLSAWIVWTAGRCHTMNAA